MSITTLIAVRPVLVEGQRLAPGSVFTVPEEHAPALIATGEAAASAKAAASYAAIYPIPPRPRAGHHGPHPLARWRVGFADGS